MYEIREYEEKDREELIELWVNVSVGEYGYKEWEDEIRIDPLKYDKILIATYENKIIGSMAYRKIEDDIAELKRVYLYKEFRGKGISTQLYNKIMEVIKKEGYKKVMVETWGNFKSGINFYYKKNFELKLKDAQRYVLMLNID